MKLEIWQNEYRKSSVAEGQMTLDVDRMAKLAHNELGYVKQEDIPKLFLWDRENRETQGVPKIRHLIQANRAVSRINASRESENWRSTDEDHEPVWTESQQRRLEQRDPEFVDLFNSWDERVNKYPTKAWWHEFNKIFARKYGGIMKSI